jgi:hypothetical protein
MLKSEGTRTGGPWSEHPMAWVDSVSSLGHRASAASGVSWGRTRVQGRKEAADARAGRSGFGIGIHPEQDESAKNKVSAYE